MSQSPCPQPNRHSPVGPGWVWSLHQPWPTERATPAASGETDELPCPSHPAPSSGAVCRGGSGRGREQPVWEQLLAALPWSEMEEDRERDGMELPCFASHPSAILAQVLGEARLGLQGEETLFYLTALHPKFLCIHIHF